MRFESLVHSLELEGLVASIQVLNLQLEDDEVEFYFGSVDYSGWRGYKL